MNIKRGRCLCSKTTFEYTGSENWCGHCHCESCRRNTSSAFTTFLACLGKPIISPGQSLVFMNPLKEYEGYFVHIVEHQWLLMQTGIQMKFFFMW
jgi:hypothetical protein